MHKSVFAISLARVFSRDHISEQPPPQRFSRPDARSFICKPYLLIVHFNTLYLALGLCADSLNNSWCVKLKVARLPRRGQIILIRNPWPQQMLPRKRAGRGLKIKIYTLIEISHYLYITHVSGCKEANDCTRCDDGAGCTLKDEK